MNVEEDEWLAANDPYSLILLVGTTFAQWRKLRLFACACCHRIWPLITWEQGRNSVDVAERYAEGVLGLADLQSAHQSCESVLNTPSFIEVCRPLEAAYFASLLDPIAAATSASSLAAEAVGDVTDPDTNERHAQVALLREIFGNPFHPVVFNPAWRTSDVVSLARQMYESRDFGAMPILADALQDAGCDNTDILNHCRDTSLTHVRGCWVVDMLLGKE
jgi:hypothetical protein